MPIQDQVPALAVAVGLLLLYSVLWLAVRRWRPWPRFTARLVLAIVLLIYPLSFAAYLSGALAQPAAAESPAALDSRAADLAARGRLDEAAAAYRKAIELRERTAGRDSLEVARSLDRLADVYRRQRKTREAEAVLRRALAIREKALGANHPDTMRSRQALAAVLRDAGKREEAERLTKPPAVPQRPSIAAGRLPPARATEPPKVEEQQPRQAERDEERSRKWQPRPYNYEAPSPAAPGAPPVAEPEERSYKSEAPPPVSAEPPPPPPASEEHSNRSARRSLDSPPPAASTDMRGAAPGSHDGESLVIGEPADSPRSSERSAARSRGAGGGEPSPAPAAPTSPLATEDKSSDAVSRTSGSESEDKEWDVVPVYYGTDRATEAGAPRLTYTAGRGRRLELGRVLVTVPKVHKVPDIERPWVIKFYTIKIYEQAEDPKQHFTIQEMKALTHDDFLKVVRERLAASNAFKDTAVVFVHGYNTSFDNAAFRTAQMAYDLKFDGAPFLYSWPSGGRFMNYTTDRESAEQSERFLREFLDIVIKETGAKTVSIVAHSMGNLPLLEVLKDLKRDAPQGIAISQLILAAPDVDRNTFEDLASAIKGLATGVTLYAASNDRALEASKSFWGEPRAGAVSADGPLILPGIDTIDVTAASTDALSLNHSGYATNNALLEDIGRLIKTGLRPPDKRFPALKLTANPKGAAYWLYAPDK